MSFSPARDSSHIFLANVVAIGSIEPNAGPESVMNMYVAKQRLYRPNRHYSDDTRLGREVETLIEDYNSRVPHGTISERTMNLP